MLKNSGKLVKISWKTLEIKESAEKIIKRKENQLKDDDNISWNKFWDVLISNNIAKNSFKNQLLKCKIINVDKVGHLAHCEKLHLNLWVIQALI